MKKQTDKSHVAETETRQGDKNLKKIQHTIMNIFKESREAIESIKEQDAIKRMIRKEKNSWMLNILVYK